MKSIIGKIAMAPIWVLIGIMSLPFVVLVGITKMMERFKSDAKGRSDSFLLPILTIPGLVAWVVGLGVGVLGWKFETWMIWTGGAALLGIGLYVVSILDEVEQRIHHRFASWGERKRQWILKVLFAINLPLFITVLGALIPSQE
jgi:hypothetical protein